MCTLRKVQFTVTLLMHSKHASTVVKTVRKIGTVQYCIPTVECRYSPFLILLKSLRNADILQNYFDSKSWTTVVELDYCEIFVFHKSQYSQSTYK